MKQKENYKIDVENIQKALSETLKEAWGKDVMKEGIFRFLIVRLSNGKDINFHLRLHIEEDLFDEDGCFVWTFSVVVTGPFSIMGFEPIICNIPIVGEFAKAVDFIVVGDDENEAVFDSYMNEMASHILNYFDVWQRLQVNEELKQ